MPVTTAYSPGEHEWGFWDAGIQDVLAFFTGLRAGGTGAVA